MRLATPNGRTPGVCHFLESTLEQRYRKFRKRLKQCQKHGSEQSVHDLRIAIRRFLSLQQVAGQVVERKAVKELGRQLKKHLAVLSPLRDAQVRLACLQAMLDRFPELEGPLQAAQKEEQKLLRRIRRKLEGLKLARIKRLMDKAGKALRQMLKTPDAQTRQFQLLLKARDAAFTVVARRWQEFDATKPKTLHRGRVAFKQFRYLVEALRSVLPGIDARALRQLHDFQQRLGEVQDLEVLLRWLQDFCAEDKSSRAGRLIRVEQELARRRGRKIASFLRTSDRVYQFAIQAGVSQTFAVSPKR